MKDQMTPKADSGIRNESVDAETVAAKKSRNQKTNWSNETSGSHSEGDVWCC